MGILRIQAINRNTGATSQYYRIEYRLESDPNPAWTPGPTLSYIQAQLKPAGVLPLDITVPDDWTGNILVKVITICGISEIDSPEVIIPIAAGAPPFRAYWGFVPEENQLPASAAEIEASPYSDLFAHNFPIITNFAGALGVPMFLWVAYPVTEDIKNYWQDTLVPFNGGTMTEITDMMGQPVTIEGYTRQASQYKTHQNNNITFYIQTS